MMKRYGLALSGGGARGAAHVGVLKALAEEDLLPDKVAGTSAGSIVAGLYASGLEIPEMEAAVLSLAKKGLEYLDPDYGAVLGLIPQLVTGASLSLSGLIKGDRLLHYLEDLTEHICWEREGSLAGIMMDSASVPAVFAPGSKNVAPQEADAQLLKNVFNHREVWYYLKGLCKSYGY